MILLNKINTDIKNCIIDTCCIIYLCHVENDITNYILENSTFYITEGVKLEIITMAKRFEKQAMDRLNHLKFILLKFNGLFPIMYFRAKYNKGKYTNSKITENDVELFNIAHHYGYQILTGDLKLIRYILKHITRISSDLIIWMTYFHLPNLEEKDMIVNINIVKTIQHDFTCTHAKVRYLSTLNIITCIYCRYNIHDYKYNIKLVDTNIYKYNEGYLYCNSDRMDIICNHILNDNAKCCICGKSEN